MLTHLGIRKVYCHSREVEFDSQHAPSNGTSGCRIVGSNWSSGWLRVGSGFGYILLALFDFVLDDSLLLTPPQSRLVGNPKT